MSAFARLDDLAALRQNDPHGMMGLVLGFPDQCREGAKIGAASLGMLSDTPPPRNVVVTGLGGSAIGGDLLRCLAETPGERVPHPAPFAVNRDYTLPGYVGPETLVIAASYSGNTEETLAAFEDAVRRRSQILCITSGGELAERAQKYGFPVITVPGGQPPRASTGYLFTPLAVVLSAAGLLSSDLPGDLEEAFEYLDSIRTEMAPEVPFERNPAKRLAADLHGRIPVLYGTQSYGGAVAVRWKGQFNENAKQHAFANVLPEQNHNEILAWSCSYQQAPGWSVIFLRERDEPKRIAARVEVTRTIIGDAARHSDVYTRGESLASRMLSLVYPADFVTVYLAHLNGADPTVISGIDRLKLELSRLPS